MSYGDRCIGPVFLSRGRVEIFSARKQRAALYAIGWRLTLSQDFADRLHLASEPDSITD